MINQEILNQFEMLYEKTYFDVSKYVICKCSKPDDVEDILQNIYLAVFKALLSNIKITKTYIMGIAKNKVTDYYRFNYKEKIISLFSNKDDLEKIDTMPSEINIELNLLDKYDTEFVWKYLKNKKVIIFKVFYLYFKLELPIKEISKCLAITESNVKHYLYRTIRRTKKSFRK